jgi:hypothetical protein
LVGRGETGRQFVNLALLKTERLINSGAFGSGARVVAAHRIETIEAGQF